MTSKESSGGGLSIQTLVIASLSSLAAALFVHEFWQGGAILGAAITPVIVALVSEALRRPAQVIGTRSPRTTVNPPPVVGAPRDDPFGLREAQRPRRRSLHVKLAVATGLVAFVIAGFFLTGAELVLGGASDEDRFRVVPGSQESEQRRRSREPGRTQPQEVAPAPGAQETAPEETPEEAPETVPPAETAPPTAPEEAPPQTVPPAETTPPEPLP